MKKKEEKFDVLVVLKRAEEVQTIKRNILEQVAKWANMQHEIESFISKLDVNNWPANLFDYIEPEELNLLRENLSRTEESLKDACIIVLDSLGMFGIKTEVDPFIKKSFERLL